MPDLRCAGCGALIARLDPRLRCAPPAESRCVGCSFPAWRPPAREDAPAPPPQRARRRRPARSPPRGARAGAEES